MARVLIVDDEPDILLMLRVSLETEGYETAMAADGETALARVADEQFDLMLLDVMMPVMDGWGVLENLQHHPNPPRVVVVSAKSSDQDVARALGAGAVDYLTKPFSPRDLSSLVAEVLTLDDDAVAGHRQARLGQPRPS
ncbi:MAG TPA: response regulator [Acidimicrobiales bacterium]|jgi:DNA-binding response OmpR family regulator|nr:response regulator [Acidimicrobiales bacterium]